MSKRKQDEEQVNQTKIFSIKRLDVMSNALQYLYIWSTGLGKYDAGNKLLQAQGLIDEVADEIYDSLPKSDQRIVMGDRERVLDDSFGEEEYDDDIE